MSYSIVKFLITIALAYKGTSSDS